MLQKSIRLAEKIKIEWLWLVKKKLPMQYQMEQGLNMADLEQVARVLADAGLPVTEIIDATGHPEVKQRLIDNTADSVARGNFGSPSFFVNEELYFGKDKLRDLEEEIVARLG